MTAQRSAKAGSRGKDHGHRPTRRDAPSGHARGPLAAARAARLLLPALALLLALWVHRRALGAFFSTDDFVRLEEAFGLLPQARTVWRLVSEVLYVKLMLALFGPSPLPFHIASMALHLANVAFVFRLGRGAGMSAAAACFASTMFGAFHLFYAVLPSAVNINDIMALTSVFLALLALEVATPARIAMGLVCFAAALLSKEAVVFVPWAAVLIPRPGERLLGAVRRLLPLLLAGALFAGLYLAFRERGLGTGGEAYAVGFGPNLFHNLMTYSLWSVDLVRQAAEGSFDPGAWRVGIWPLTALAATALLAPERRGLIAFGCAWWLLGLAPVLPLLQHSYGHYLYAPMAGLALASAAALETLPIAIGRLAQRRAAKDSAPAPTGPPGIGAHEPRGGRRAATAAFVALALAFAARSESLIRTRASERLGTSELARDPFTRKMEVAQRAVASVKGSIDRAHDSVVVFVPEGFGRTISATTGEPTDPPAPGVPQYDVIEAVLDGGRALALFEPRIDSVVFVSRWTKAYQNFTLFIEGPGGQMANLGRGVRGHAHFASALIEEGYSVQARDYLAQLVEAFPRERMLRLLFAAGLVRTGDRAGAGTQARRVMEEGPADSIGAAARRLLASIGAK